MNKISIQSDVAAEDPLKELRVLAISDAAPSRNGAGAYYLDLLEHMKGKVKEARLFFAHHQRKRQMASRPRTPITRR